MWKIHLLWQVLIKLRKDRESESHVVHRRTEEAGVVHFRGGAVSRFHVKPRRVAEGPFSY